MAQQSLTVTTFRALVMLTCVLLIPLAAVCGTSFPSVVKAIQNGRCPTLADFRGPGENARSGLSAAPPFTPAPASYSPASTSAAISIGQAMPNSGMRSPQSGVTVQSFGRTGMASSPDSSVVPASYEVPVVNLPGQSTTFPQNEHAENRDFAAGGNRGVSQPPSSLESTSSQRNGVTPNAAVQASVPAAGASQSPGSESSNPDATFKFIQDRLQRLGATYYLLEAWGDQKDAYRFYCRMPIGGNPQVWRPFQNVDPDPLKAMANVLQQIEDWQKRG